MSKNIFIKLLICCIFIHIISISFLMPTTYALGDIFSDGKAFLEKGNSIDETINTTELKSTSDYIYNGLLGFAVMVAIIVAMVLGIQFMLASADEKAKVKEALMPFVVGCVVVFGSFTIWKAVVNIGNDAENNIETAYCVSCGEHIGRYDIFCSNCSNSNSNHGLAICPYCTDPLNERNLISRYCEVCESRVIAAFCPSCGQNNNSYNIKCSCGSDLIKPNTFNYCADCGDSITNAEISSNKCTACNKQIKY